MDNRTLLNQREIYWIEYYDSTNKDKGYNITKGGTGGQTHDVSGKNNPMYAHRYTDEEKKRIGEYSKGKKRSQETRNNISKALKGKNKSKTHRENLSKALKGNIPKNAKSVTVINIYTNEIITFKSEGQMERELKCSRKTINNGSVTHNGYKKYNFKKGLETIESIT